MFNPEESDKLREEYERTRIYKTPMASLLDLDKTMQWEEQQTASDKALNVGKALYNGYMSVPRGVLRGLQAVRDYNIETLNEANPDRMQADEGFIKALDSAADAEIFQPYNVRSDSAAEQFVYDLAQGAGQLGGQATVGVLTGGYGTLPAMALQIGGEEYKELRDAGVDVKTAGEAALFNAAVQTPLEYIGFSKLMKRFPGNTMFRQRVRKVAEDIFTEGFTEFLQEYPEQASMIWAKESTSEGKDASQVAREIFQTMWDHAGEILPGAAYSGLIGAGLGGGAGALHLAIDNRLEGSVKRAMQREMHTESMEHVESTVNRIKETGVNPQYAAAVVNDNMQNQEVHVDGEALYGYAQEAGVEKVAESLGVSVDVIEKAAADGDTVDIKLGNFEATSAAFDGFLDAVKDDTAFEDGGYTVNKDKTEQAWAAAKKQQDDAVRAELDRIEGEMKEAVKAAGIKADVTREMITLLARARMWSNPVEALKKLSYTYGDNAEGYAQFAGENAETADKVKLAEAQQMEADGKAADEIYKQTGWFKGLDNRWRFEIDDNLNDIDLSGVEQFGEQPLGRVYYNEALFDAYPQLRLIKIQVDENLPKTTRGEADAENQVIRLNKNQLTNKAEMAKTLVHEIQHFIQDIEDHASGGSPTGIKGLLREHIRVLKQLSKEIQKENPSYAKFVKAVDAFGKAATAQSKNPSGKAEKAAVSKAYQELNDARNELSEEDKKTVEPLAWRIRELTKAVNSKSSAYDLYYRLGGEQEARYASERAEQYTDMQEGIDAAKKALDNAAEQATPEQREALQNRRQLHEEILETLRQGEKITDEQSNRMDEYEKAMGEDLFAAWDEWFWETGGLRQWKEDLPTPHGYNAIIIFNGVELPYSQKRDESPAGEKTAAENTADKERINVEVLQRSFKPAQITSMQKAVSLMAENALKNKKIQDSDNDAVIIEKMLANVIRTRDTRLLDYEDALEKYNRVKNNMDLRSEARETLDKAYNKLVEWQKILDYERWWITHGREDVQHGNGVADGGDEGGSNSNPENGPGFDGGANSENGAALAGDLIYKVPGSHDKNHYNPIIRKIRSEYAEELPQQQNNAQAQGRSKKGGFSYAQNRKGDYNPTTNIITLFKGADASTVIHETWHFFVEQMWQTVQGGTASEQTAKDFETLLNYAGMTMKEWAAADVDGRRKAHEKLAEAGETYIMEGKAPSHELRRVFKKFAQWLKDVYRTLQRSENYAEITDEVREVFDRMLAAEDDIAEMERINGYFAKLPDVITENMSDETRAKVEDYIAKAREKAVYILTRRALKDYSKKRREEVKKFKEEIRPRVEEEVSKRPVYACGYDKADAARFRMLQDQQAGVGVWTSEDFINRAFDANVSKIENEVANLAAMANPKNWGKGLAVVRADYVKKRDKIMQPALDALADGMGQGVDVIRETNEYGEAKGDIVGRVSNNAQWYRDFYAEHKRRPNKAEMEEMARQLISGDVYAPKIEGWTPTTAEEAEALAAEGERLADIERHIETCDAIKDRLAKLNENYNETSAAGSEMFMLEASMTAERYGYSSADEMMKAVEAAPSKSQAIRQRTNELVAEMTGENERANYEASIRESLYNEDEALLIGVEQQLIAEYAERAKERQSVQEQKKEERKERAKVNAEVAAARKQQAKNLARADLAKMNVKEATRTSKFITAERNAAVKSAQLLAKKKYDEALKQKNLQAYWHAMAAESIKISRRQKQNEKFIKTQVKLKPETWLNETHFAAISQLFTRMGIARPVHKEAAAQAQFENLGAYAAAMEEQFDCVDIAPWILDGKIPIDDTNALTLEQNEDVINAIKNIKAIVRAQKGVNTFNKQETWANTKALMMEKLSKLKTIWTPNPNKPTKATNMERFTASMETLDSFLEYLDDAAYGWFSQTWGNTIKRASDKEYEYKAQYDKADADALKKWLPDEAAEKAANEEIYYDELGNSVTKHTLVKMLINLGNKENSQRLCETIPVGFEKSTLWIMPDEVTDRQTAAEQTRQNLIDFLGRVLTKEDVEYAQRKIDAAEMFWGEKNELEKRVKGFGLKKVEATPVELEIDGEPVVLRGGYFPLMRNGETGSHSANAEVDDADPLQGKRIRTYHTNTSATKARTNARYPVNLFPGAETQWIYESIHDLCWREVMNDFRRVLNDQELFATLKSKVGVARMQVFKEMLEVAADPQGNSKSMNEFEKLFGDQINWLRQRTSHAVIMLNLKVIAQNYANALLYGNAIEGYTMADNLRALGTYMLKYHTPGGHAEMVDFVFSKSSFLRERCELPDITVRDIVDEKKEFSWEKAFREIGIKAMAMTDNATAIPNWLTAYNNKINEGRTEQEAIDYADALVRRVLGSSRITDVSSMQRARAYKVFTMFQSFFNARYNEFLRMERIASKQWTQGQKQEAFANVASYVVYKWLGQTMLAMALALQNPFGIDDEDKWPELIKELKSYSFSMMGPVGQLGNALVGSVAGMHEYTYRMSAIESTVENVNRSIKRIHSDKATTQDKVEGIMNTATMLVGVPSQLNRIFWNAVDILFNGMSPEIGDIMRRRPKSERR